jgi:5-methylcytosine-specific restriction endonuclease McrA
MNALNQNIVLVLNKAWQPVNTRTPQEAFLQMATDVAVALDISGDQIVPVHWDEWMKLPIREGDRAVQTVRGPVRIPAVIVLSNYGKIPKKRPKLCSKSIRERDGNKCQYSGRILKPEEGSLDHVMPRSRGGRNEFENLVWASKDVNAKKANKTPEEAGLRLLSQPRKPKEIPVSATLRNTHAIPEWDAFLRQ